LARRLRIGDLTFCTACNFNKLRVAKITHKQPSRDEPLDELSRHEPRLASQQANVLADVRQADHRSLRVLGKGVGLVVLDLGPILRIVAWSSEHRRKRLCGMLRPDPKLRRYVSHTTIRQACPHRHLLVNVNLTARALPRERFRSLALFYRLRWHHKATGVHSRADALSGAEKQPFVDPLRALALHQA